MIQVLATTNRATDEGPFEAVSALDTARGAVVAQVALFACSQ